MAGHVNELNSYLKRKRMENISNGRVTNTHVTEKHEMRNCSKKQL